MIRLVGLVSVLALASLAPAESPQSAPTQPDQASAQSRHSRIRFGGIYVAAGYSRFSGGFPYYLGYPGYWYDPFFFTPIYAPGYYTGFPYGPSQGAVKIQGAEKDAWIYLDGALAGRAEKLKELWLDPGVYNLELRQINGRLTKKIYVLTGKTLTLTPDMMEAHP